MNQGKELEITDNKSIISELNADVDINQEKIENLETNQSIRQSTQTQILTMFAKVDIQYNVNKALLKANVLIKKFLANQVFKLH